MFDIKQKEVIAMVAATSIFSYYMNPANRGPSWTPADMPTLISQQVQDLAKKNSIPEEFWLPMVTISFDFYELFLKPIIDRDYNRIWRK
jgi:hypothetical protein